MFPSGDTFRIGYRQVWFDDVATDSLEKVQAEFDAALKEQSEKGIDARRMKDIIARQKRKTLAACEDDPQCVVSLACSQTLHLARSEG